MSTYCISAGAMERGAVGPASMVSGWWSPLLLSTVVAMSTTCARNVYEGSAAYFAHTIIRQMHRDGSYGAVP